MENGRRKNVHLITAWKIPCGLLDMKEYKFIAEVNMDITTYWQGFDNCWKVTVRKRNPSLWLRTHAWKHKEDLWRKKLRERDFFPPCDLVFQKQLDWNQYFNWSVQPWIPPKIQSFFVALKRSPICYTGTHNYFLPCQEKCPKRPFSYHYRLPGDKQQNISWASKLIVDGSSLEFWLTYFSIAIKTPIFLWVSNALAISRAIAVFALDFIFKSGLGDDFMNFWWVLSKEFHCPEAFGGKSTT